MRRILILCVDGLGSDYIAATPTPTLDEMARAGGLAVGRAVIPSVTNVNNVSLITGRPPSAHGITSNYWLDREAGQEVYMESAEYILCETILERARRCGVGTALLTAKAKLLGLLNRGTDLAMSAEMPLLAYVSALGPPGDIYSADINHWLLRAVQHTLATTDYGLVYATTTDGMMHKHAPEEEVSIAHVQGLDRILGQVLDQHPGLEVYLTADHGMSAKSRGVDLEKALGQAGLSARAIPIIKDRYVAHHNNLGGAAYVYLDAPEAADEALEALRACPGVEEAYGRQEAAAWFDLMAQRIGDLMALADADTVFGDFAAVEAEVHLRSHGSRHEAQVPIYALGRADPAAHERALDMINTLTFP